MAHGPGHRTGVDAKAEGLGVAGGAESLPLVGAPLHSEEPPRPRIYGGMTNGLGPPLPPQRWRFSSGKRLGGHHLVATRARARLSVHCPVQRAGGSAGTLARKTLMTRSPPGWEKAPQHHLGA